MMERLPRRPVATYNDVISYAHEVLRIHQLPTDDLYSFKLCFQYGDVWWVTPVTDVKRVTETWKREITLRGRGLGDIGEGEGEEINCLLLMNELGEVVGHENISMLVLEGDDMQSFFFTTRIGPVQVERSIAWS